MSTPMLEAILTVKNGPGKITPAMVDSVNVSMYDHKNETLMRMSYNKLTLYNGHRLIET